MPGAEFLWVYIMECTNGHFYTGMANDLSERFRLHREGRSGSRYTRSFRPVNIAACWKVYEERGPVMKVEACIKGMSRSAKESLVTRPGTLKKAVTEKYGTGFNIVTCSSREREGINKSA